MTPPVLRHAAMRRMPWRNGGGETTEVAAHPPDGSVWRVSVATVAAPGPFSLFPGMDRSLAVLEGEGLVLEVSGMPAATLRPGDPPHAFPGDRPAAARPLGGPATVLNVMTRRGGWRHALSRRAAPPRARCRRRPAGTRCCWRRRRSRWRGRTAR